MFLGRKNFMAPVRMAAAMAMYNTSVRMVMIIAVFLPLPLQIL